MRNAASIGHSHATKCFGCPEPMVLQTDCDPVEQPFSIPWCCACGTGAEAVGKRLVFRRACPGGNTTERLPTERNNPALSFRSLARLRRASETRERAGGAWCCSFSIVSPTGTSPTEALYLTGNGDFQTGNVGNDKWQARWRCELRTRIRRSD